MSTTTTEPRERLRYRPGPRVYGALGLVAVIALWWISAETIFASVGVSPTGEGGSIPNPAEVVVSMVNDGFSFYAKNLVVTMQEAAQGYLWGNGLALLLAALVLLFPPAEGVVTQVAVISYCIPITAIGPIIRIVIGPPDSGDASGTAIFLGAMLVFFTTVIGALLGLKSADRTSLDIVTVYGGGRWKQLTKVRLIAALPSILNALKIAAPAAFLGAIIGEYLGGVDLGVGPALVNAQQALLIPRAWGLAIATGLVSGAGYALLALVARLVTPWTRGRIGN
jgi:ABC-type nitrate/sulfonate/bicarbonate transport system permease component